MIGHFVLCVLLFLCTTLLYAIPISDITQDKINTRVSIEARVVSILPPRSEKAPYVIYVTDDSGAIKTIVWQNIYQNLPFKNELKTGITLLIEGTVNAYRNELNLYINGSEGMKIKGAEEASQPSFIPVLSQTSVAPQSAPTGIVSPGNVNEGMINQTITVQGMVREYVAPRSDTAPHSIYIQDMGGGTAQIVYWSQVADDLGMTPSAGMTLRIKGEVSKYRENLQLKVYNAVDITDSTGKGFAFIMAPAQPTPPPPAGVLEPGRITSSMNKQSVTVQGMVKTYKASGNERAPSTIILHDSAGNSIDIVYWNLVSDVLGWTPSKGQALRIKGEVGEYRGNLQIKVRNASDIIDVMKAPVSTPLAPRKPKMVPGVVRKTTIQGIPVELNLSQIKADNLGNLVKVRGKVVDIKPSWKETAPTTVTISDGVSQVDIVYWKDLDDQLPSDKKPEVGARCVAIGKLSEFRGKMQVKVEEVDNIQVKKQKPLLSGNKQNKHMNISDINHEYLNVPINIKGRITGIINIGGGRLVKITDDTGTITVPMWDTIIKGAPCYGSIREGAEISINGIVDLYKPRNEIQVKILDADDVDYVK